METLDESSADPRMLTPQELLRGRLVVEAVAPQQPDLVHIAVAFAGRLLSDLGARVVRVVPVNDPLPRLRSSPLEPDVGQGVLATYLNRGKQILTGGGSRAELGEDSFPHLLISGDEDEVPEWLTDGGLPKVCTTAAGLESGLAGVPVSELGLQGLVGLTDLFGEPGAQPLMMGGHQTAYATGYAVFCAALASLTKQALLNEVDTARVNAVDTLAWVNWKGVAAGALGFPVVRGGSGAEAPVLQCADGYFAFLHMPGNWQDIVAEVGDPRLHDEQFAKAGRRAKNTGALNRILADWAATKTWSELYEFCQRAAIPGGPVLCGEDLLDDPLYQYRGFFESVDHRVADQVRALRVPGVPLTLEGVAEPTPNGTTEKHRGSTFSANTPATLPLSGKLVIDLGIFTAGSVTSTLLADLGATVIKVESQSYSDPFRIWPGLKGDSPLFTFNNRNKLGLNLDLKTDAGRDQFLRLVERADVVVENFRRGVLERLGIDYPVLMAANPNVVLVSVSGQGASGPGSGHVSFGSTLEAIGGVAALTGYPGEGCYISGRNLNYPDQIVCLYGAGAAMAALLKRSEIGCGMHIDVSQREVTTLAVGEVVAAASLFGGSREFPGNSDLNALLQDVIAVADGWLCVSVFEQHQVDALLALLECDAEDLEVGLAVWLGQRSAAEAIAILRPLGISVFRANSGAEAAEERAIQSGAAFATTPTGKMVKGFPFQFDSNPLTIYEESPSMGEQTEHLLELLNRGA